VRVAAAAVVCQHHGAYSSTGVKTPLPLWQPSTALAIGKIERLRILRAGQGRPARRVHSTALALVQSVAAAVERALAHVVEQWVQRW
jgi:hypothetical protein